jgi:hypothetical protein
MSNGRLKNQITVRCQLESRCRAQSHRLCRGTPMMIWPIISVAHSLAWKGQIHLSGITGIAGNPRSNNQLSGFAIGT